MSNLTAAQADQQKNRDQLGQYQTKVNSEPDPSAAASLVVTVHSDGGYPSEDAYVRAVLDAYDVDPERVLDTYTLDPDDYSDEADLRGQVEREAAAELEYAADTNGDLSFQSDLDRVRREDRSETETDIEAQVGAMVDYIDAETMRDDFESTPEAAQAMWDAAYAEGEVDDEWSDLDLDTCREVVAELDRRAREASETPTEMTASQLDAAIDPDERNFTVEPDVDGRVVLKTFTGSHTIGHETAARIAGFHRDAEPGDTFDAGRLRVTKHGTGDTTVGPSPESVVEDYRGEVAGHLSVADNGDDIVLAYGGTGETFRVNPTDVPAIAAGTDRLYHDKNTQRALILRPVGSKGRMQLTPAGRWHTAAATTAIDDNRTNGGTDNFRSVDYDEHTQGARITNEHGDVASLSHTETERLAELVANRTGGTVTVDDWSAGDRRTYVVKDDRHGNLTMLPTVETSYADIEAGLPLVGQNGRPPVFRNGPGGARVVLRDGSGRGTVVVSVEGAAALARAAKSGQTTGTLVQDATTGDLYSLREGRLVKERVMRFDR